MIVTKSQRRHFAEIQRQDETLFPEFYGKPVPRERTADDILAADVRFDVLVLAVVLAVFAAAFLLG